MTQRSTQIPIAALAIMSGLLLGCGKKSDRVDLVDVSGTVYLDDQPHGPAQVTFAPVFSGPGDRRKQSAAAVNDDGTFTLNTYEKGDGASPGEFTVTLSDLVADPGSTDPAVMMKMMGGGDGPLTQALTVTIPPEGHKNIELRFNSTGQKRRSPSIPTPPIGVGEPTAP